MGVRLLLVILTRFLAQLMLHWGKKALTSLIQGRNLADRGFPKAALASRCEFVFT